MNLNIKTILVTIFVLILTCQAAQQPFKKVIHNIDPRAKCLDGSPPAIYIHQGSQPSNFIIFFNGGGFCSGFNLDQTLGDCYLRSKTDLGSSKNYPDQKIIHGGYLSTDPQRSKFATWTKVLVQYCDSSMHQGSNNNSIKYKDTEFFFRGADNTRAHLKYLLQNHKLAAATNVVLTGSSAGAIAASLWTNYVRSLLDNPNVLVSIYDSGVFMNIASPQTGIYNFETAVKNIYRLANADEKTPNSVCNNFKSGQEYKCFFMEVLFTSIQGRILVIGSQYDSEAIPGILDIKCLTNGTSGKTLTGCSGNQILNIQNYRANYLNFITNFMHFSKNNVWSIACSWHVYAVWGEYYENPKQKVPESTGETVRDIVQKFVFSPLERINVVDKGPWPANGGCAK